MVVPRPELTMRQGFSRTMHLNNQRAKLARRIRDNEASPDEIAKHAELADAVFNGLIEEIQHMHRDISAAENRARRPW
jgi:hypothetical protein